MEVDEVKGRNDVLVIRVWERNCLVGRSRFICADAESASCIIRVSKTKKEATRCYHKREWIAYLPSQGREEPFHCPVIGDIEKVKIH